MKKSGPFRFKEFAVNHDLSSMKVGVDAVLTGALAPAEDVATALDVGCGCGVISLMIAQRVDTAQVTGIDVDLASVEEASGNFKNSPWVNRLIAEMRDFSTVSLKYDLIVSNPPFFRSGISTPDTTRLSARHQDTLSPFVLIKEARRLLTKGGRLCFIFPAEFEEEVLAASREEELVVADLVRIRGHESAPVKRVVITLRRPCGQCEHTEAMPVRELILEVSPGIPTDEYRELCRDFYLKF